MVEPQTEEVVDLVEKNFGDEAKSKKTVEKKPEAPKAEEVKAPEPTIVENKLNPKEAKVEETPEAKAPEVKVEPKVEPAKEVVTEDDFNDFLDVKPKEPLVKEQEGKVLPEKDLKRDQEFEGYKKDAETFRSLAATPIGKVLLRAQELGKNPLEVLSDIAPKDYQSMSTPDSDEARAAEYFSKVEGLQGDELKESIAEFTSMDEGNMKRKMRREQVADLTNLQQHKLKDYQESLESDQNRLNEIYTRKDADVDNFVKEVKKKKGILFGMQLTDDQLTEFSQELKGFNLLGEDGFIDVSKLAASYFFIKHGRQRLKENYLKAHSKGQEEILEIVHNVSREDHTLNNTVLDKKVETREDKIEAQFGGVEIKEPFKK